MIFIGHPRIDSVLVAVGALEDSVELIQNAADLAIAASATLHLVHVDEGPASLAGGKGDLLTAQRRLHERRIELYELLEEIVPNQGVLGKVRVSAGRAAEVILAAAEELDAQLIVLGAHRNRGMADRFLGSTAEEVLRRAAVPCLLLNAPLELPIRRVLVGSDFSPAAEPALEAAAMWGRIMGRQDDSGLVLAHIHTGRTDAEVWPGVHASLEARLRVEADEVMSGRIGAPSVEVVVRQDANAARSIMEIARQEGAGLIVLGTQGERVLIRALLGSTSAAMVRDASLPLMIIPTLSTPFSEQFSSKIKEEFRMAQPVA